MDSFSPCIVIPVYNHWRAMYRLVEHVVSLQIEVIIIDDGSHQTCKSTLAKIEQAFPESVELISHQNNRGKGAVVCEALKHAKSRGFTHAIQVDADGQHKIEDIPKFLSLGKQHPDSIISASRPYASLPKNRRYGRMVTDFWVCVNTLSLDVKDSMCGFRLYPLHETCKLLKKAHVGQRMDFDTDILVRLYWQGVRVKHITIDVVYDTEDTSHFDLLHDNIRISRMHTLLFFGMLVRIPVLLSRKFY